MVIRDHDAFLGIVEYHSRLAQFLLRAKALTNIPRQCDDQALALQIEATDTGLHRKG